MRTEGRCFTCKNIGHESRNCPERKTAKPPTGVQSGSIRIPDLEKLANEARAVDLGSVRLLVDDFDSESDESSVTEDDCSPDLSEETVRAVTATSRRLEVLFTRYYEADEALRNGMRPEERFSVGWIGQNHYSVTDWVTGADYPHLVLPEDLDDWNGLVHRVVRRTILNSSDVYPLAVASIRKEAYQYLHMLGYCGPLWIDVIPDETGFVVRVPGTGLACFVTHQDIRANNVPAFSYLAHEEIRATIEPMDSPQDPHSQNAERRRRWLLHLSSVAHDPSRKPSFKPKFKRSRQPTSADAVESLERTAARPKDLRRRIPRPVVVIVKVNGKPVRALLDTGSMADFISTTIVDQLKLETEVLVKPLPVQLAVHGSRSKINHSATVDFSYQGISGKRRFDVVNLDNYDMILGTPFLFQHRVAVGFNPTRVVVGSDIPLDMKGEKITVIASAAADLMETELDRIRAELKAAAMDLCPDITETDLPPFRDVNHTIPLIDESKVYRWRPSKCPEALKPLWRRKKEAYLRSGRWRPATGTNVVPMLIMPKKKSNGQLDIRTPTDTRDRNANTVKMAAPLPDVDGILRNIVRHRYRTLIDGNAAFEQIRIVPEHVSRTLFTTPDGTMESLVMQLGDCNGTATYQTLMNHIFSPYIGVFMDVYLDDILIYSDTIEDHVKHIHTVFNVLREQKLFLNADKMQFFARELKILGHIIDDKGIAMDPHKIDSVVNWKVPTNKGLLSSFLGAVGYLAPDCADIRIPMGVLAPLTGSTLR